MEHDRDRWQRIDQLFHAALARQPSERQIFLENACEGDETLLREVESRLAHEQGPNDLLDSLVVEASANTLATPKEIGHYRILDKLGEGGMGVVYIAEDQRLGRQVALKMLRADSHDANARSRLVREARLAAGISHPLICQVFDLGEWGGQPFIVMELLAGKPLTARLVAPLPLFEALRIASSIIDALCVLHHHGIVHRDLKPSNIFVSGDSIKVLDFGLARSSSLTGATQAALTQTGAFVGTPQYAAPEQLLGAEVDARADLFSAGAIFYEMIAGRPLFQGRSFAAIMHAVLYDMPPVLTGSATISVVDRILHRMLSKRPEDRYPTADAVAADLLHAMSLAGDDRVVEVRQILRLAVLPFRLLKPESDIEYLSVSFADALVSSLSGFESLVVRSTLKTARFAKAIPDLAVLASDLSVDIVLSGTILRQNDRLRFTAELVSVPAGDVWWTQTMQVRLDQVFELHDQLAEKVIQSLPLTVRDQMQKAPARSANTKGYDLYLRGMQLRMESSSWRQARSFFGQCLDQDPAFAPAWAEQGRLDRILGKYEDPAHLAKAESSFLKALELDPENGAAQHYYAQLEIDLGRVEAALSRLLKRAGERRAEPFIYAALVHAFRYSGLLDEYVASRHHALHLDPTVYTSVLRTYTCRRDTGVLERRIAAAILLRHGCSERWGATLRQLRLLDGRKSGFTRSRLFEVSRPVCVPRSKRQQEVALAALQHFDSFAFNDGEGLFYVAEIYARIGLPANAYKMLERSVAAGFWCLPAFELDPYLAPLREDARWRELLNRVRTRQQSV